MEDFKEQRSGEPEFPDPVVSLEKAAAPEPEPEKKEPEPAPAAEQSVIPPQTEIPVQADKPQQQNTIPEGRIPPYPQQPNGMHYGNPQQPNGMYYGNPQQPNGMYYNNPQGYYPPPSGGGFYGGPPPMMQYEYPPQPAVPPVKVHPMSKRVYSMAAVCAVLVFMLCVYCIGSDILHGALGGETVVRNVKVELITQEKPELDPAAENVTADGEYTVKGVAELVKPSIVEVYTYSNTNRRKSDLEGTGSGIIISEDGYIVTNAHVVQGLAFSVVLDDESEYNAELIGSDSKTDLAILKINAAGLPAATLGNSDETYVGENVVAIGNPAGLTNTVTKGIVSAIGRQVRAENNAFMMDCIQTDAAISPGNSGGALVNMYGQVIGITSSKYASQYSGAYEGLGFAITINEALPVLTDLMEEGYVSGRFRIGISFASMDSEYMIMEFEERYGINVPKELSQALWISEISEDCDISNTELQADDFILEIEGQTVASYDDVLSVLDGYKGGDVVTAHCARINNRDRIEYFDIEFMLEEDTSGNY